LTLLLTLGERHPAQGLPAETKDTPSGRHRKTRFQMPPEKETMMFKLLATTASALVLATAVQAQDASEQSDDPPLNANTQGLFADGTWDCNDAAGDYLGAIVVADLSYAFINPDATLGSYGKLNKDSWVDAPGFMILSGEVKDRFGGVGMYVKGPLANPEDYTDRTKLRLQVVITAETFLQCARRLGPAT
jgi:hypothetical protein